MLKIVGIKFSNISMPRFFATNGMELMEGDFCLCPVEDRTEIGYICSKGVRVCHDCEENLYPRIIRKATDNEILMWEKQKERESEALQICREKAQHHKLNIKISSVKFDDQNNKIVFNFTADKRVDFRELVRDLASTLRSRIELWQIGVRDEARNMDGFGVCGCRLCCSSFIKDFQPVTIRMAKNQDIFLSPNKLSGCCGRLMCCLSYEENQYIESARTAAEVGDRITTKDISGIVVERNLLNMTYMIQDEHENRHHIRHSDIKSLEHREKTADEVKENENDENYEDDCS